MAMKALKFKPGIIRDITSLSNENGYVDCDKIRFRNGYPEKLGGWVKFSSNTYQGSARRLHNWVALDGSDFLGIGSHLKYYIEEGQNFNDITPIRFETSAGDVTFTATENSNVLTVNDPGHHHEYIDQYVVINNGYRPWPANNNDCAQRNIDTTNATTGITVSTTVGNTGSGTAIENRPPYYALCYIMKT